MYVEDRPAAIQRIDLFIPASPKETLWVKELVSGIDRYFPLIGIPKLIICHIVAKKHPKVIVGMRNITAVVHDSDGEEGAGTD